MSLWRILGLGLAILLEGSLCAPGHANPPAGLGIEIRGPIGPAAADDVTRSLRVAGDRQAPLVVLFLDTPGGLDRSMRTIIGAILASPVPVLGYVAPSGARAASAGTYILTACSVAAMAPGTTLGAATPVTLGKDQRQPEQDPHAAKAINDAAAYIRGLANLHGRNAEWLESAVRQAATLTGEEAAKRHVVDFVAADVQGLLAQADGRQILVAGRKISLASRDVAIEMLPTPWHSRFLAVITQPDVAYLLLLVGVYGLIFELMNPGFVLPGLAGAISLLVAFYGLDFLPLDYAGLGLLGLGLALMAAEPFVVSHGVVAVAGVIAFAVGSVMLLGSAPPGFRLSLWVVAAATAGLTGGLVWLLGVAAVARRRPPASGADALIGTSGRLIDWQDHNGHVLVGGEAWQARSPDHLAAGQPVVITGRHGLVLDVTTVTTRETGRAGRNGG